MARAWVDGPAPFAFQDRPQHAPSTGANLRRIRMRFWRPAPRPGGRRLDHSLLGHRIALGDQLGDRGVDARAREVIELEALDDRPLPRRAGAGKAADQLLGDAIGALRGIAHRNPATVAAFDPVGAVADGGPGPRAGPRRSPRPEV